MAETLKYPVHLPNRGSKLETPASLRIDLRYARLGIKKRWDWDRFIRTAAFLNYTPAELASIICLRHSHLDKCQRENGFPEAVCMLLTLLEARAMAQYRADAILDPFQHDSPQGS